MTISTPRSCFSQRTSGFSLTEVILAVGVIAVSILALLGLFGPTMSSVRDVVDSNEANGVRTRLNAALMSDEIYDRVSGGGDFESLAGQLGGGVELYFWTERQSMTSDSPLVLKYSESLSDFTSAMAAGSVDGGSIFVVTLEEGMQGGANPYAFGQVAVQGYFPIFVSIYAADIGMVLAEGQGGVDTLVDSSDPLFSYTTAKLR
ncbi:type IV pilus modification PilV family protein [Cerasicoccus frondis]|uniref:type IV pilus modification PilV family protein n=1 Tax=Cerasicoccus frondis TaxID=490090 RepID=UPI0028529D39|nr:hypothetical protein [Cerasicoccus frondis]